MSRVQLFILSIFVVFYATVANGQTLDSLQIRAISIHGNSRTKASIILREIPIEIGQSIAKSEITILADQWKINLTKTSLFNFVDINWNIDDSNSVYFSINVQERWYFIPRARVKTLEENINAWAESMDFNHLSATLSITDENFRGYNEKLTIFGSAGYNQAIGIEFLKPSFVINKEIGVGVLINWCSNKEASIGLFDYKPKYLRTTDKPLITNFIGELRFYYRPRINVDELFSIGYSQTNYSNILTQTNRIWYPNKTTNLIRLYSKFKIDNRDNKSYPTHGSYYDLIIKKDIDLNPSSIRVDYTSIEINSRWYRRFTKKILGSFGTTIATTTREEFSPLLGLKIGQSGLEVRSFEQFLIPVYATAIGRSSLKYQLLKQEKQQIKFTGNPKFDLLHYALYATVFADGALIDYQRAANYQDKLLIKTNFLSSVGVGLDFSSYYDLVVRLEYSYNFVFEKAFLFLHFKASI